MSTSFYYLFLLLLIDFSYEEEKMVNPFCEDPFRYDKEKNRCCDNEYCCGPHCLLCVADGRNCLDCEAGFRLKNGYCGKRTCGGLDHCKLCNDEQKICYECSGIFYPKKGAGKCEATDRIIAICLSIVVSLLFLSILCYCLCKPNKNIFIRKMNDLAMFNNPYNDRDSIEEDEHPSAVHKELTKEELEKLFLENKISFEEDYSERKCGICLTQNANFILSCGCSICSEHEGLINVKNNTIERSINLDNINDPSINQDNKDTSISKTQCPICNKDINKDVIPITCGICFNNKKELGHFGCKCAFVVCKECFIQWKSENTKCPACRNDI
ncbi:MAG: hypothetical protein MJ252_04325 [archaeon]|nr:hypothetical protein [archaeon]